MLQGRPDLLSVKVAIGAVRAHWYEFNKKPAVLYTPRTVSIELYRGDIDPITLNRTIREGWWKPSEDVKRNEKVKEMGCLGPVHR